MLIWVIVLPDTVLASNSSAIPTTEIGRNLVHRERVVGTHFWNPPHLVPLVEVIQNEKTSEAVVARTIELLRDAGKVPVHVRRDIPGFVGNRLQHALKREAIALVAAGVCDAETLDTVVKEGFWRPHGGARTARAVRPGRARPDADISEVLVADLDRSAGPHPFLARKLVPASSA